MKRARFTEEQVAYALRLAESGTQVVDVRRQLGVSEATFHTWKKKYADFGVSELRKLKQLEDENARLRRIVADLTLESKSCRRWCEKSLKAAKRRELAAWMQERFQISTRGTHLMHLETMRFALWRESAMFLRRDDFAPMPRQ
jgi:putative transposase